MNGQMTFYIFQYPLTGSNQLQLTIGQTINWIRSNFQYPLTGSNQLQRKYLAFSLFQTPIFQYPLTGSNQLQLLKEIEVVL